MNYKRGILPVDSIINKALKLNNPIFCLSGPAIIQSFLKLLKENGIKEENIEYDNWE